MRSRPDLQWLSEHDVEKAFAQAVESLEKDAVSTEETSKASRSDHLPKSAITLRASKL
jgi:salicylate hydroxylase